MEFQDKQLKCSDCGSEFVFTAGEQLFFQQKGFTNTPKRCKRCKAKRSTGAKPLHETTVECAGCGIQTTVPFKPSQGRPVLCRACFRPDRSRHDGATARALVG